ncbi:NAD-dependent protein deacetylase [Robbsia andropogonis]|uniref:NAD-dependent protein deacetylase n=1 Tax=Robbsia andropogonis TaxID=28092 RepID=UPI0004AC58A0|nr:NAD-dependent protein deacetylase [Robbsia andropogonis]
MTDTPPIGTPAIEALAPDAPSATALETMREQLRVFMRAHRRVFVITGAGCSTESGIADYRDRHGAWKRPMPITLQAFTAEPATRRRYWARAMIGWRHLAAAVPNDTHRTLARWEQDDRLSLLVTQNVDGLHQAAGSTHVVDLHGRLDGVRCLKCGQRLPRADVQDELARRNPHFATLDAPGAPDGDADLELATFAQFDVPDHAGCGGLLKPDVVFFGESVPPERVREARTALDASDALLIIGSSLMVYSGYRFAVAAAERRIPLAALNVGHTRADELLSLKIEGQAGAVLRDLAITLPV